MTIKLNREHDFHVNQKRIYRLMQVLGLKSVCRRNLKTFHSYGELKQAVIDYIEYYNGARYQKRLNCMTPLEYGYYLQNNAT